MKEYKVSEIAAFLNGTVRGDGERIIRGVADIKQAAADELSFVANPKYAEFLTDTQAGAVIVNEGIDLETQASLITVENADEAFSITVQKILPPAPTFDAGVHASAVVAENVVLGEGVFVGPQAVIEAGAHIGAGTQIHAGTYIGHDTHIGENCLIHPNITMCHRTVVGNRVVIHPGTVIGSDGFGFVADASGAREKIPQLGNVTIGDDVEIGAQVAIDRARFGSTKIGNGVKIDNLVMIAHNVVVGDHAVIVSQVGISGSTIVGEKAILAGQVGVAGHLKIGAGAIVLAQSGISKDVPEGARFMGYPAVAYRQYAKQMSYNKMIPSLIERIKKLEES